MAEQVGSVVEDLKPLSSQPNCLTICPILYVCGKGSEMWGAGRSGVEGVVLCDCGKKRTKFSDRSDKRISRTIDPQAFFYSSDSLSVAMSEALRKKWQHERQSPNLEVRTCTLTSSIPFYKSG